MFAEIILFITVFSDKFARWIQIFSGRINGLWQSLCSSPAQSHRCASNAAREYRIVAQNPLLHISDRLPRFHIRWKSRLNWKHPCHLCCRYSWSGRYAVSELRRSTNMRCSKCKDRRKNYGLASSQTKRTLRNTVAVLPMHTAESFSRTIVNNESILLIKPVLSHQILMSIH